jgi:hypothetical protein
MLMNAYRMFDKRGKNRRKERRGQGSMKKERNYERKRKEVTKK